MPSSPLRALARRTPLLIALVAAATALSAAPAFGAAVSVQGDTMSIATSPGQDNCLTVTVGSSGGQTVYQISDCVSYGVTFDAGSGCRNESGVVMCPAAGIAVKKIDAGDGNDNVIVDSAPGARSEVTGGAGDDTIKTGAGNDVIDGGDGKDQLNGSDGDDQLSGGAGDDKFTPYRGADVHDGGAGNDDLGQSTTMDAQNPDVYRGGDGTDSLSYGSRAANVSISLDGVANDGEAGEGDNVAADIETIDGGPGSDTITGGPGAETINGGGGNDTIDGGAGNDIVDGGINDDRLNGGAGDDTVRGAHHSDTVEGGPGRDQLEGDLESIYAEGADDVILARDGEADTLRCGLGTDTADVDAADALPSDSKNTCENVRAAAGATPGGAGDPTAPGAGAPAATRPLAAITASRLTLRRNAVTVPVRCTAPTRCRGTVQLRATVGRTAARKSKKRRTVVLASRRVTIAPGRTAKVKLKIRRSGRRHAKRLKRVTVVLQLNGVRSSRTVKLVRRR